jgi:hypothetical protein
MAQCVNILDGVGLLQAVPGEPGMCSAVVLSGSEYSGFLAGAEPNYEQAAEVFGFFFATTLMLWSISKVCGIVLSSIRRF